MPKDQMAFRGVFETIRRVYELFGYLPLETPAVELEEVLLAKGGGQTEQQVYRLAAKQGSNLVETGMALRFDLTVPLARYVSQHIGELALPFRRYQMQPVWRGEGPQRGRYREFYQCDIDVIGTFNPMTDAEIPSVIYEVFKTLNVPRFVININNRKIINGLFEMLQFRAPVKEILHLADKLDKIGPEKVLTQLLDSGENRFSSEAFLQFLALRGRPSDVLSELELMFPEPNETFVQGMVELRTVCEGVQAFGVPEDNFTTNMGTIRGLDYYTGTIYETQLLDYPSLGSVCSGGRYDNLCAHYTDQDLPGVGISIGLSRLFYQLKEVGLLPKAAACTSKVVVLRADNTATARCMEIASSLRQSGVNCEVYLEDAKLGKQLRYASRLGAPFAIIVGEKELASNRVLLKSLANSSQQELSLEDALTVLKGS
jgi:histidyl-tRNA synthetase